MEFTTTYRRLVKPEDLNPANRLFGGRMMEWLDEAAALFAMCQVGSKNIVTLKFSEITFHVPVKQGDFLEFQARVKSWGNSSVTIEMGVWCRNIGGVTRDYAAQVLFCEVVFVHVDENGKAKPHGRKTSG